MSFWKLIMRFMTSPNFSPGKAVSTLPQQGRDSTQGTMSFNGIGGIQLCTVHSFDVST